MNELTRTALERAAELPMAPFMVEREKVREFARAVLSTDPLNFDLSAAQAAGYQDLVAPPTFAAVVQGAALEQLLASPGVDIALLQVLHGTQSFNSTSPIVAGDQLLPTLSITSIRSVGATTALALRVRIDRLSGGHVVTADSMFLISDAGSPGHTQLATRRPSNGYEYKHQQRSEHRHCPA